MALNSKIVTGGDTVARIAKLLAQSFQDQGGDPDARLQWFLRSKKGRDAMAKLATDMLFLDCTNQLEMVSEPERNVFRRDSSSSDNDFLAMLEAHFDYEKVKLGVKCSGGAHGMTHCYSAQKNPKVGRECLMLELTADMAPKELHVLLRKRKLSTAYMYDLVRVRNYDAERPLIALGSSTDVIARGPHHPMLCKGMVLEDTLKGRTLRDGPVLLNTGDRILVWRKKK
jgi:hypothetical protein